MARIRFKRRFWISLGRDLQVDVQTKKKPDKSGYFLEHQAVYGALANNWAISSRICFSFSAVSIPALIFTVRPIESLVIEPA